MENVQTISVSTEAALKVVEKILAQLDETPRIKTMRVTIQMWDEQGNEKVRVAVHRLDDGRLKHNRTNKAG